MDFKSFLPIVKEFVRALRQKRTYNIFKNGYCIFGILWGIPIPIVTIGIDLYSAKLAPNIYNISWIILNHPFHFIFLLHPLFFGIVFGAMGSVRYNKEQKIKEFEENLIGKNIELEEANKKLTKLSKMKSNFLSMVSHELRTPLTTIQGYISFLRSEKEKPLTSTQREYLRISEEEAEHLNHLIQELLDLSKIERKEFKINLEPIDMKEIVNKAMVSVERFAKEKGVILENNLGKNIASVWADKEKILQVVINLMENGIKFNKPKGKVSISSFDHSRNNKIIFCIQDTGIGISEDKLERIFDNFYQVDSSINRRYRGCGLGLTISKNIIELHKGRIWIESKLGVGSKFFFELKKYDKTKTVVA